MIEEEKKHIVQIIPADGWIGVYEQKDGSIWEQPLIGFALVDCNDGYDIYRTVVPLSTIDGGETIDIDETYDKIYHKDYPINK